VSRLEERISQLEAAHAADEANKENAALLHLDLQEILEVMMMRPLAIF
jgi:hypothetical protein